jgi:hypothetical protein
MVAGAVTAHELDHGVAVERASEQIAQRCARLRFALEQRLQVRRDVLSTGVEVTLVGSLYGPPRP